MTARNPFAAPADAAERVPTDTTGTLWGMRSRFALDGRVIEVETSHWSGLEVYRVDGQERTRKRNLGWHARERLQVGAREVDIHGRWYPLFPVVVEVDGVRVFDDLFPQVRRLTRAIGAVAGVAMTVLTAGIALDLWRWLTAAPGG